MLLSPIQLAVQCPLLFPINQYMSTPCLVFLIKLTWNIFQLPGQTATGQRGICFLFPVCQHSYSNSKIAILAQKLRLHIGSLDVVFFTSLNCFLSCSDWFRYFHPFSYKSSSLKLLSFSTLSRIISIQPCRIMSSLTPREQIKFYHQKLCV